MDPGPGAGPAPGPAPDRDLERSAYFSALSSWVKQASAALLVHHCFLASLHRAPPPPSQAPPPLPHAENRREVEYVIPPFWKRIVAEVVDFLILVVLKGVLILVVEDHFSIVDYRYLDYVMKNLQDDYRFAVGMTWELIVIDLLLRTFTCVFESVFLSTNHAGRAGGATPGKALLGLRVVSASSVVRIESRPRETVLVYPGTSPPFRTSLGRSVTKNSLLPFLLPVFLPYFFAHNRTFYDVFWNVIVVQDVAVARNRR